MGSIPQTTNRTDGIRLRCMKRDRWEYDRERYKRRNQVERLFRRLKRFRRIFSRFEKLDVMFLGFISFAFTADGLRCVDSP